MGEPFVVKSRKHIRNIKEVQHSQSYSKAEIRQRLNDSIKDRTWNKKIKSESGKSEIIKIITNSKGREHILDDIKMRKLLKYEDISKIGNMLKNASFVKSSPLKHKRKDSMDYFYYFKAKNRDLYFHVGRMNTEKGKKYILYSITKRLK